ncbi:AfaD family invasin [Pantoea ananatis]|uniref:AfaD family invasin n=2 Tax=Pantoea ananas TaxID=553 RepID=UPI000AC7DAAD|nr:AfaD family invasin [Pantoea ananatis]
MAETFRKTEGSMAYDRKISIWSALLAGLMLTGLCASGAENPGLQLRAAPGLQAGPVRDGTLLIAGRVSSNAPHAGFRLRCETEAEPGHPGRCTLAGQRDPGHRLRVRLSGPGWQAGAAGDGTMMVYTADGSTAFRLEADGDQHVEADTWTVALSASVMN